MADTIIKDEITNRYNIYTSSSMTDPVTGVTVTLNTFIANYSVEELNQQITDSNDRITLVNTWLSRISELDG